MFASKLESYFLDNEKKVNKLIAKFLPLFCFIGPIILICDKIGFFDVDDKNLIIFSSLVIFVTILFSLFTRKFAGNTYQKFYCHTNSFVIKPTCICFKTNNQTDYHYKITCYINN